MRTRGQKSEPVVELSGSEEEAPSTSSDEEQVPRSGNGKRGRKYYRPEEEEDGDEEGSEGESDEVDDADEDGEQVTQKAPKRRKRRPPDSGRSSLEIDLTNSEPYDEEEAALKRALSLSVRDGTGASGSRDPGPASQAMAGFDAEEAALQAALAASLADAGQTPQPTINAELQESPKPGPSSNAKQKRESSNGKKTSGKGSKAGNSRAAFPEPSLELVQQAFQMLDPTGAGIVNRVALKEVAQNLLHNELSEGQVDAMMDYAEHVIRPEGESSESGLINAEDFHQLVARFASPSAQS